jgi:hypothetical protein
VYASHHPFIHPTPHTTHFTLHTSHYQLPITHHTLPTTHYPLHKTNLFLVCPNAAQLFFCLQPLLLSDGFNFASDFSLVRLCVCVCVCVTIVCVRICTRSYRLIVHVENDTLHKMLIARYTTHTHTHTHTPRLRVVLSPSPPA